MHSRTKLALFTIFAPITVPVYLLFIAGTTLVGGAYYLVVEASLARLIKRPVSFSRRQTALLAILVVVLASFIIFSPVTVPLYLQLIAGAAIFSGTYFLVVEALIVLLKRLVSFSPWQVALFAIPVVLLAPVALCIHLILLVLRGLVQSLIWIGRWQIDVESSWKAFVTGLAWTVAAIWISIACLNAAFGMQIIGKGIPRKNLDLFVETLDRPRSLAELPPEARARRDQILGEVERYREAVMPEWQRLEELLKDDETRVFWLPQITHRRITGVPWFFKPKELSEDGLNHSALLLGPLLFAGLLLVRWPGTSIIFRNTPLQLVWYFVRVGLAVGSIYYLVTWEPITTYLRFHFKGDVPTTLFKIFSPAHWWGFDFGSWVRPEWYFFNAALWILSVAAVVFIWRLAWQLQPILGWPRYYVPFLASRLLQRKRIAFVSVGAVTLCVAMMIIVISVMGGFVDKIRSRAHGLLGDLVMDAYQQGFPFYQEFIDEISSLKDPKTGEPIVIAATPLIHTFGVLQFPKTNKTKAVRIWGIRLDEYVRVNDFGKELFYQNHFGGTRLDQPMGQPVYGIDPKTGLAELPGDMDEHYRQHLANLPKDERAEAEKKYKRDNSGVYPGPGVFAETPESDSKPGFTGKAYPGIIVGRDVLFRRLPSGEYVRDPQYPRGTECSLTLVPILRDGSIPTESPPKPFFRYVDDSRTGIHEIDSMNVYVDFERLQSLLSMGSQERADGNGMSAARCSQMQIKVAKQFAAPREVLDHTRDLIEEKWKEFIVKMPADSLELNMLNGVGIQTWEEMQQDFIAAIEKEKVLVLIMFGVISVVAVFLILCIFYMIVQEKTRDIGIIKSIGGSTEGVAAVFLFYGAAIGLVGSTLGSLLGIEFVEHINQIQDWLARINPGWRVWSPETYSFDTIPSNWKWSEVLWISGLSIAASIIGAAFPAIRAGRTWPVESLRYE